jgi:predicted nucleic acid-binding Zn ribbon protein
VTEPPDPDSTAPDDPDDDPDALSLARDIADSYRGGTPSGPPRRRRPSRASPRRRKRDEPERLADVIGEMTRERGWDERLQAQRVFTDWTGVVGPEIAAHSRVEGFEDGIVSIRTDSTAWAKELKLLAPRVVHRLNEELGHGTVLRIEVNGPQAPSWKKGLRTIRNARGPRDTYG